MAYTVGSVTFTYALKWTNKNEPTVVGSETRTRSGDMVLIRTQSPSQKFREAHLIFEWATRAQVTALMKMWKAGGSYSANFEGNHSYTVRFAAQNGVANVKHQAWGDDVVHAAVEGYETDLYTGELNLIICT